MATGMTDIRRGYRQTAARVFHVFLIGVWVFLASAFVLPEPVEASHEALPYSPTSCTASHGAGTCANVSDGNTATAWVSSGGTTGSWVSVDLGSAEEVTHIRVRWGHSGGAGSPPMDVQHSPDASAWTTVTSVSGSGNPEDTGVAALSTPTTDRYWRLLRTGGNASLATSVSIFQLSAAIDHTPAPTPTPTPNGGENGGDDGGTAPLPIMEFDPHPKLETCTFQSIGQECTFSASQIGKPGTEMACEDMHSGTPWAKDSMGRPRISCAEGWPGARHNVGGNDCEHVVWSLPHLDVFNDCDEAGKQYRTWYLGRVVNATTVRMLFDYGLVVADGAGGYQTCNPHDADPEWNSCLGFPMLGGLRMLGVTDEGGMVGVGASRTKFRGATPGCGPLNGPPYRWGASSPGSGGSCANAYGFLEHLDYSTDVFFTLPHNFTGRLYVRVGVEPARNLRSGDCPPINCHGFEDESKVQVMGVRAHYAYLSGGGYWHNASTAPADEQTPAWWPSCGGGASQWRDLEADACWNEEPFSRIGDDGRTDESWPEASGHSPEACLENPNLFGCDPYGPGSGAWAGCYVVSVLLDIVGHLAYIGCLVAGIPGAFSALLGFLFIPSSTAWDDFIELVTGKVPFGWFAEATGAIATGLEAGPTTLPGSFSMAVGSGSVDLGQPIDDALGAVQPFRGIILAGVALVMILGCIRWIMAAVGVSPAHSSDGSE